VGQALNRVWPSWVLHFGAGFVPLLPQRNCSPHTLAITTKVICFMYRLPAFSITSEQGHIEMT
jgi:hypothetical protein